MNRRSVSCQVLLSFLMMMVLVVTFGCSSSDSTPAPPATASATYTWDSGDGDLIITWTSSNIPCNAPPAGLVQTEEDVTITTTTMTWPNVNDGDGMIWTRSSGTPNDPAGTWTSTDPRGNIYTAVITASSSTTGSISLSATIIACSSGDRNPGAQTVFLPQEGSNQYRVEMWYDDPGHLASAVSVTGPGIIGSMDLTWNWGTVILLGNTLSTDLPYTYIFAITPTGTKTVTVSCFLEEYATDLTPTGTIYATPTNFTWTGISADAEYEIVLFDSEDTEIWRKKHISGISIAYDGPSLTAGITYHYDLFAWSYSTCPDGYSRVGGTFTYSPE